MKDLTFTLQIVLDRFLIQTPDLGAVTLSLDGREYILDVVKSYMYDDDDCEGATVIPCDLEIDEDTFEDCPYDLTVEDLVSDDLLAEFYINDEEQDFEIDRMNLFVTIDGVDHTIKVVEE